MTPTLSLTAPLRSQGWETQCLGITPNTRTHLRWGQTVMSRCAGLFHNPRIFPLAAAIPQADLLLICPSTAISGQFCGAGLSLPRFSGTQSQLSPCQQISIEHMLRARCWKNIAPGSTDEPRVDGA